MRASRILTAALVVLVLSACAPTPAPAEPSATAAAPTPSATPETPQPQSLTIRGDRIVVEADDASVLVELDYFAPVEELRSALSDTFGFEPEVSVVERTPSDRFAGTTYRWDGFELWWRGFETEAGSGIGEAPHTPAVFVVSRSNEVRGISVGTVNGVSVGDDIAALATAHADSAQSWFDETGAEHLSVRLDPVALPPLPEGMSTDPSFGVSVSSANAPAPVDSIVAPAPNFGL